MTDKEAFDLLLKYGGEKSIILIKDMIHVAGADVAIKNIKLVYQKRHGEISSDLSAWIEQGVRHIAQEMTGNSN